MSEITIQTSSTADGTLRLTLDGPMNVYNAHAIKGAFLDALKNTNVLELDLAQVNEMDTAGFQLLVLAKRESQLAGKTLHIIAYSQPVRDVIVFFNMDAFFGDPMVIPADTTASTGN